MPATQQYARRMRDMSYAYRFQRARPYMTARRPGLPFIAASRTSTDDGDRELFAARHSPLRLPRSSRRQAGRRASTITISRAGEGHDFSLSASRRAFLYHFYHAFEFSRSAEEARAYSRLLASRDC